MSAETIELVVPAGRDWAGVARLVLGGVGDRFDLGFDELDDLQLAVERLLAEAGAQDELRIAVDLSEGCLTTRIGPLSKTTIVEALQGPESRPGDLNLRRVLETVVDAFAVEEVNRDGLYVTLDKRVHGIR